LVGICFGISMTIKPHAAIGAPLVVLAITWSEEPVHGLQGFSGLLRLGLAMGVGLAIPLLAMLAYLAAQGALPAFLDIVQHYWPLYSELNIVHQIVAPADRPAYLVTTFFTEIRKLVPWAPAILGAGLASARANLSSRQRSWVGLLWALAVAYTLYPIPAGKFWNYHWLPATYCYALLGGLCLLPPRDPYPAASSQSSAVSSHRSWFRVLRSAAGNRWPAVASILPVLMLGVTLIWRVQPPDEFGDVVAGSRVVLPKIERIDRIAAVLRARLQPGDTVQPLDWTGGAGQAMMIANARPATDFVEDFYFYHHIDDPYIQMLRQRFITQFDAARPRFVIQITAENKPWPSGPRTTREFPELTQRLTRDYRVVLEGDGYRVLERISG
jgi:hypothetical protein